MDVSSVVITLIVITPIWEKLFPPANRCEQRDQLPQLRVVEMAELQAVNLVNSMLHLVEQMQSVPRDPSNDIAAVLAASLPHDQLRVFEAIEKARHVWNLADQSLSDFTSAQALRLGPTQDPENVVLRRGDAVRLQSRLEGVLQQGRRPLDAQVNLLFEALERPYLFQLFLELRGHSQIIRVITHIVNLR
jgi:hypothetical protein